MDERVMEELKFALARMNANTKGVSFWKGRWIAIRVVSAPAETPERFGIEIALEPFVGSVADFDGAVIALVGIDAANIQYAEFCGGTARWENSPGGFYKIRPVKLPAKEKGGAA